MPSLVGLGGADASRISGADLVVPRGDRASAAWSLQLEASVASLVAGLAAEAVSLAEESTGDLRTLAAVPPRRWVPGVPEVEPWGLAVASASC